MPVTNYLWDGDNLLRETDDTGAPTAEYTYSPERYGELISEHRDGTTYTHHYDAEGSTVALTNDTGSVTDTFAYTAWGEELSRTGTTPTAFRWVGRVGYYWDVETSEYQIRRRSYGPSVARWKSPDPLGFLGGSNFYVYVDSNPINQIDPSGLATLLKSPSSAKGAPWCEVSPSDNTPFGGVRDPINGLPAGNYGRTDPLSFTISCDCGCCDSRQCKYRMTCTIIAYFKIRICPYNFTKGARRDTVYGHEQDHLQQFLKVAEELKDVVTQVEDFYGCNTKSACQSLSAATTEGVGKFISSVIAQEEAHGREGGPGPGEGRAPTSRVPSFSDCTMPGPVPSVQPLPPCGSKWSVPQPLP